MKKYNILFLFLFLNIQLLDAQIKDVGIIPFIKNYTASEYNAAQQNWAAIQDHRGIMYFANTDKSILEFDGKTWNKIKVPTVVISFEIDDNGVIYVGGKGELGYLKADKKGVLDFVSLRNKVPYDFLEFDKIWDVFITKDSSVCFQTLDELFIYKNDTIEVVPVEIVYEEGLFIRAFQINNEYYVHTKKKGLYTLDNGLNFVEKSNIFADDMVKGMLPYKDDKILVVTWSQGMFVYDGNNFEPIETGIDELIANNIYRTTDINGEYFVFSLYHGGLLVTDNELNVVQLITSDHGLQNDQITNFYLDNQNILWLCLANGIASVNLFTPFTKFDTNYGFENESKTLTSKLFNNTLYIGTATGVYYKQWKKEDKLSGKDEFKNVNNESGNVKAYHLEQVKDRLICAGALGTFEIIDNTAKYIVNNRRLRTFRHLKKNPDILIGGASGLFLFKEEDDNWNFIDNIKNFDKYSRYIEEDEDGFVWMSDASKGIYKIYLSEDYKIAEKIISYDTLSGHGLRGLPEQSGNYVFKLNKEIVFGTSDGIYKYDKKEDVFFAYEKLNTLIGENEPIVMIKEDGEGNIWFKQKRTLSGGENSWELGVLLNKGDSMSLLKKPFLRYKNKIFSFSQIDEYTYIIGAADGFVHYDSRIKNDFNKQYPAFVRNVKLISNDSTLFGGVFLSEKNYVGKKQLENQIYKLPFKHNNIRITFSAAFYEDLDNLEFKYYLEGNDKDWSMWTKENYKEYSNLSPKQYIFFVKAKNIYGIESTVATYEFSIFPPWYRSSLAYTGYVLLAIFIIFVIVNLYTRRLRKQKEQLEQLVKERTIEIEQANEELEAQTEELEKQNIVIQKKNEDITSSIEYAERIQRAMLPVKKEITKHLKDNFILFKPRDIVSGDFYWFAYKEDKIIITAADCTGHGVPGAFMSMIGAETLTTIVNKGITKAGEILKLQNQYIRSALKQETSDNQDGMDMALCVIDKKAGTIEFAGAKNPLLYIHEDKILKVKGDKQAIGGRQIANIFRKKKKEVEEETEVFKTTTIEIKSPMWFYLFSDGYQDQFGGENGRKFMIKRMKNMIFENHKKPMEEQNKILDDAIENWKNEHKEYEQTDDILIIGFKL